jgi:hypothetical protein
MAVAAAYQMLVRARSAWNTGNAEAQSSNVAFQIRNIVTSVSVTPNLPAPQAAGTTITWTATATGGVAPLQYRWIVYDGTTYAVLRDWSAAGTDATGAGCIDRSHLITLRKHGNADRQSHFRS